MTEDIQVGPDDVIWPIWATVLFVTAVIVVVIGANLWVWLALRRRDRRLLTGPADGTESPLVRARRYAVTSGVIGLAGEFTPFMLFFSLPCAVHAATAPRRLRQFPKSLGEDAPLDTRGPMALGVATLLFFVPLFLAWGAVSGAGR